MISSDIIVGIDVGTTKICTVVARMARDGSLEIIGLGRVGSRGLRKGLVVDLERTIASVKESKLQAEQVSGTEIDTAFVGVTGSHIQAHPSNAVVAVADPHKGITSDDTERALDLAQRVDIPRGRRLIDVRVREYIVDGQVGIADPIGMSGMRLEVNTLLITASVSQLENIYRAINNSGIDVEDIILVPIASAEAVLTPEEKESGVAVADIGGGTTDLAVFQENGIAHIAIFPVGGDHFDSDLSYGIGITAREAEHLKVRLGGVGRESLTSEDLVEISKGGGERKEKIPCKIISEIIYPRMQEILYLMRDELDRTGLLKQIPAGLVLTGGTSIMPGIGEMASDIFGLRTRIGYPRDVEGLSEDVRNPMFATAVGLIKLGRGEYAEKRAGALAGVTGSITLVGEWMKTLARSFFR